MNEAKVKHMVNRFLDWRLPDNFHPDGGISFKRFYNEGTPYQGEYQPSGTNLFNAEQAEAMIRFMIASDAKEPALVHNWSVQVIDEITELTWWGTVEAATEEEAELEAMQRWEEHHGKQGRLMTSAHLLMPPLEPGFAYASCQACSGSGYTVIESRAQRNGIKEAGQ